MPDTPRRGRPPKAPEERAPRRSGPSGKHRRVEGAELVQQRERMLAALHSALDGSPEHRAARELLLATTPESTSLPRGYGPLLARALGMPGEYAGETLRQMWAGIRGFRVHVRIF